MLQPQLALPNIDHRSCEWCCRDRETIAERERLEKEEQRKEADKQRQLELRKADTHNLVIDQLRVSMLGSSWPQLQFAARAAKQGIAAVTPLVMGYVQCTIAEQATSSLATSILQQRPSACGMPAAIRNRSYTTRLAQLNIIATSLIQLVMHD